MYIDFNDIVIELDASVRHITSAACMHLSSILEMVLFWQIIQLHI